MASKVTSRDVQEIVSKLSSDKAKAREEGIKLLNTWLEGERSIVFCKYLSEKTALLGCNDVPHSETWPFIISILIQCVALEVSSSKKRVPKLSFAKTLRIVVQRAEDTKFSGKNFPLLSVAKILFNHIWDILRDVPGFQSEYAVILRHLLAAQHYRFHMRKRVYSGLVLLYIERVHKYLDTQSSGLSNPKEEVFRCILTLHSLLENPPGDFPNDLREDIVGGFIRIFAHVRDEGKISRKLIECINTYLSKDGPNMGSEALEIHDAIQHFVFRFWITTHDRSLKDALVLYARLQLNLTRGAADGGDLLEQLLEVLSKELDHMSTSSTALIWTDTARDEKGGALTSSQHNVLELSALVFCRACGSMSKAQSAEKRARREHASDQIKDGLMKGKWSWHAAFCYLIHNYASRIRKALIACWFESISYSFETIINNANAEHAYDGLLWTLRSLQVLSQLPQIHPPNVGVLPNLSFSMNEFDKGRQKIWGCIIRSLPIFSNVSLVADAALLLVSSMILNDTFSIITVPQDIWNLRLFKSLPSVSVLHFIACYFSRRGSQGDLRDALHLRQNLLRSVLSLLNWKESFMLNEHLVVLLPLTTYALCSGCAPLPFHLPEVAEIWVKAEEHDHQNVHKFFELSVEMLATIDGKAASKVMQTEWYQGVHIPRRLRCLLLHEAESHILETMKEGEIKKMLLSDVFFACALLSNLMCCSYSMGIRFREDSSLFISKLGCHMIELMDQAAFILEKTYSDVKLGCLGPNSIFNSMECIVTSIKSFFGSPHFNKWEKEKGIDGGIQAAITHSIERLLKGVAKVFDGCSEYGSDIPSAADLPDVFDCKNSRDSHSSENSKNTIVDMELDVGAGSKDVDILALGRKAANGFALSSMNLKMEILSFISAFFSVLPSMTWDILFNFAGKESNPSVLEALFCRLCQHLGWSSDKRWLDLVTLLSESVDMHANLKLQPLNILDAVSGLVQSLLYLTGTAKDKHVSSSSKDIASEEEVAILGDLVNKVAENNLFEWHGRSKLVDCICNFVLLKPEVGQCMIEKLLMMLRDPDYRVRLTLARRISVLFQTWDGHHELLQDICSSFGAKLVVFSKEKVVTAKEVLSAGPQARPQLETAIITLMHLALESDKIELEAVFMICAVAAIDPCQRELVSAVLDNLSRELQYSCREKYMEELIGPIIFFWVACSVNLVALIEMRDLFVAGTEPSSFMQYCCQWLLPALILNEDLANLNWVAKVSSQPPAILVKSHFVHIFSVCMALHCSKLAGSEKGLAVLESSVLSIAEISENERDKLIKKTMVSIVNHLFSLAAASADPAVPFFTKDTIKHAIQTVVDGFMEISREEHTRSATVVDKINIFRPDRVFMFIVEMHYKITAAANHRHKCNRLAGIEVLIDLLEHRAGVPSTFNYLFNLVGQYIGQDALLGQCCHITFKLLEICKSCPQEDTTRVLGEQLPFLVSKLITCFMASESGYELSSASLSGVLSLLHQLIVHSDPSFYEYIKELEFFPVLGPFDNILNFQKKLCLDYSPKNHLINLAKRSHYLPARILILSLKALHRKFFGVETCQEETAAKLDLSDKNWNYDENIVHAVWNFAQTCSLHDTSGLAALVSDFVSKIGIGDPHRVVFDLPGEFSYVLGSRMHSRTSATEKDFHMHTETPEALLYPLMRLLMKYLMDDSVKIIDIAAQALRGILSTEKGQTALLSFDSYERSLIQVHSKGIDMDLVQKLVLDLERKFNALAISPGSSTIWKTTGKTFEIWICPLVHGLIGYCDDIILRLCQDIVLLKSEVAELLLPNVMVNLARKKDLDVDLCKLISVQVQENIFTESNTLMKSIQVILDALNELRLCHVLERATTFSGSHKRESLKSGKPSSSGAKSRSTSMKHKEHLNSSGFDSSTFLWEKVYWLPIDYLVVAKSALNCGSYFTAVMYVEHWCEEHFNSLTLGSPDFSHLEVLPCHTEILASAVTQINEPDSLYGIIQSHKLTSQIIMFEHEGNWTKALELYDLLLRSGEMEQKNANTRTLMPENSQSLVPAPFCIPENETIQKKPFKGLMRSFQQIGCTHVLDIYCQGLASQKGQLQHDLEFTELQYEAAWRAGDWDFSLLNSESNYVTLNQSPRACHFNQNLHSCFRALEEGDIDEFHSKVKDAKQELLLCICNTSKESTEYIHSTIVKLQIFHHLGMAWELRWSLLSRTDSSSELEKLSVPRIPSIEQLSRLSNDWNHILEQAQLHMTLLEPFIAFRRILLQILNNMDSKMQHLLDSASILRKGCRFSQAVASLHEFKSMCTGIGEECSNLYLRGRLEEAKLLRAQGQHEMAINLAKYISQKLQFNTDASDVFRLLGKWLAETHSSNSRTVLEKYLKHAVAIADNLKTKDTNSTLKQCQMHFHLAHYADALFRSYEDRLNSSEWQAAMRLRKLKTKELEALIKRFKNSSKGEQIEYSIKIQELQKQLKMDKEEDEKLQVDRDNFLRTALEGYKHCLVIGDKYDIRVVFRLVSLWFALSSRPIVVNGMLSTIKEVQSYKFIPLMYQIASRMGGTKDGQGPQSFQFALISLVKKMAVEHPYHTIFQLLALANGDRIKDKQRSRNSFVVDKEKKDAAENLLKELYSYHGAIIRQMKQMVEIYIKLAELEMKREDTNRKVTLPRDIRGVRELELAPVVTSNFPVDRSGQYPEGSFPHFRGLADSVTVMNGINAPKVVECLGSDGKTYRQLAKSGNDDLRQDAVMEQFFGLVNTFLQNQRDTQKRRLRIRTYKVVPFTPSAGVLEWVNGTVPLGEYLVGSNRNGGAHARYGVGDWLFSKCRQHMTAENNKRKAFEEVCQHFRPVMHYFFLERFLHPSDWFEKRLAYTRSVAASSMVGYIVGLGDRHAMNILIDQATAEVVHIDLGVAFEQGLMLKTPERVPFRLTRDIVDGMGATGVEGVFRRCCEETLSVMRTNKEALLTIVEVFIHDPLYKWALSPLKALQRQKETDYDLDTSLEDSDDEYEGNKDAARALLRVKQKLDGYEEGEMRSVHGQVQQLIQDAIDPDRLCELFPGWGAWM